MIGPKKVCKECGLLKPLSAYHNKTENRDGLNSKCKPCIKIIERERRMRGKRVNVVVEDINLTVVVLI